MKEVYTIADLQNWDRIEDQPNCPIRLGVFGHPVAHSISPQTQNAALKHCELNMRYARFEIEPGNLSEALRQIREHDFVGINLTIPHKLNAVPLLDELDPEAKRIGAVNVIKAAKRKLFGYNTDGRGFSRAIREEFSVDLRDLRVLVLGAGGGARAVAMQCAKENCERLVIANRSYEKAKELADDLREFFAGPRVLGPVARLQAIPWEENAIRFQVANSDLIVNVTPLGLHRSDPAAIPSRLLAPHLMIYDTIYSEQRTPFVSAAFAAGARAANGSSMLLHQAALSFELWFEREAPIEVMRGALPKAG